MKGCSLLHIFDRIRSGDLERRELHLTLVACSAIIVLAGGLALFMFPVVFSAQPALSRREFAVAFFGFCGLSVLLAIYLIDRQLTILRLRHQIDEDRRRALAMQEQTSAELFKALPNFQSFQDQLSMEYRRAATSGQELSLLVVTRRLQENLSFPAIKNCLLGDAAKAILRKLRKQDSFYLLQPDCFGLILPGTEMSTAERISSRFADGLTDAAGVHKRFTFELAIINYPRQASCAQELERTVCSLLPDDPSKQRKALQEVLV
jgi:GGDEF domain-containing protein